MALLFKCSDHAPPHFHALYGEHEALIDLRELRVLRGSLPRRAMALVLEWAADHRDELIEDWNLSSTANSEADQASEVVPAIRHVVPWRIVAVEALPDHRLRAEFVDGTAGEIDLGDFLVDPRVAGTVFEPLRDSAFFAQAAVIMGAVQWPNGADLAPDAMYDAIRKNGMWTLE